VGLQRVSKASAKPASRANIGRHNPIMAVKYWVPSPGHLPDYELLAHPDSEGTYGHSILHTPTEPVDLTSSGAMALRGRRCTRQPTLEHSAVHLFRLQLRPRRHVMGLGTIKVCRNHFLLVREGLRREIHAPQQVLEARVGA
jgi:hypothetical protein